jgi:lysophospholipase L1-like esterase
MIRPVKIFLYFVLIALMVLLFDWWLSNTGISLVPHAHMGRDLPGHHTTFSFELAPEEKKEIQLDDSTIDHIKEDSLTIEPVEKIRTLYVNDSILIAPPLFQNLFKTFCANAKDAGNKNNPIRILHIGDSQIEADRITEIIRNHFQNLYGGSGPGYIMPYDPLNTNASIRLTNKGSWNIGFSYRENNFSGPIAYGFAGKAIWFTENRARFNISPVSWKSPRLSQYNNIHLLIKPQSDSVNIDVTCDDIMLTETIRPTSAPLQIINFNLPAYPKQLTFDFSSPVAANAVIHGLTLDGHGGVAVDNFSMRGRPWPGIRLADNNIIKTMAHELDVGMIIFQFGTNVLPTITDNYNFYRIHFLRELRALQKILPDIPVLIIGVQSAATRSEGEIKPLKHSKQISNAQKAAALACDMGFLDLNKAMGGNQGAVNWAKQTPSLMLTDYMHFSREGARQVGNILWTSLNTLRLKNTKSEERE